MVQLIWTPGHSGIQINERVDSYARNAAVSGVIVDFDFTPDEALRHIKKTLYTNWNNKYKEASLTKGKLFQEIFNDISYKPWYWSSHFGADVQKSINRLLAGHCYNKPYLARINILPNDLCDTCNVSETLDHCIFVCSKYSSLRNQFSFITCFSSLKDALLTKDFNLISKIVFFLYEAQIKF